MSRLKRIVGEEPPPLRQPSGAILTPKLNKHRDPAKSLVFPGVPEVLETKELITMLGRQDQPIIAGPWLTEVGFELLYWIPFLAWAKAYGSIHDDQLIVISQGRRRVMVSAHHAELSRHPVVPGRRRIPTDERGARTRAEGSAETLRHRRVRPRDHRKGSPRARSRQGEDPASVADVQPVQRFLAPAGADHPHRGLQRVPAAAETPARRSGLTSPVRICGGEVLREFGAA